MPLAPLPCRFPETHPMSESTWKSVPWALAIAASTLVVLLARRDAALEAKYAVAQNAVLFLRRGSAVPQFRAASASGDTATIGAPPPGSHEVDLVLRKSCPHCRRTLPIWRQLVDSVRTAGHGRIHVYAIALDSLAETERYLAANGIAIPVVEFPTIRERALFRAGAVPQTVVVNEGGGVLDAHVGEFQDRAAVDSVLRAALTWPTPSTAGGSMPASASVPTRRAP